MARQPLRPGARALDKDQAKGAKDFEAGSKDIPEVLKTMMAAPYELGQAMLAVAVQQGGDRAVDDLFRSPPKTEEQQLDPWTLVADHQGFLNVPEPELADGEKALAGDDNGGAFGALGWLLVLSERVPVEQALTAVDGWGGDASVAYERDGTSCLKANYRGDTPEDLAQMQTALQAWVSQGPEGGGQRLQGRRDPGLHVLRPGQEGGEGGDREVDGRADARADAAPTCRSRWSRPRCPSRPRAAVLTGWCGPSPSPS